MNAKIMLPTSRPRWADALIQVLILAELYKLSPTQLVDLGAKRLDEFKKKGSYVEEE